MSKHRTFFYEFGTFDTTRHNLYSITLFPYLYMGTNMTRHRIKRFMFVTLGRTGRAGRSGEAITLYTESDVPFLRNIANVMAASGCEVPNWILSLSKKKWRKHRPHRESISTMPPEADEEEK